MYIINTSFIVEPVVHEQWLKLIREKYVPFLMSNGLSDFVFTRLLSEENVAHFTYSLQVSLPDLTAYKLFQEQLFPEYVEISDPFFGDRVVYFTSLLKRVEL